ncbi:calcium-binding protein [Falsirhodobacter deserti]|uniref:calcium-binding protein n=1 Tax=Falsirhodobacter deserti TaxID=1365611 RepID=UPI0013E30D04|nr:calcium-binding protein [Falsirhodobacter deserti]
MESTSHLNIINLQVMAEDQIAIDQANGTYEANLRADSKYYLWQSDFQTIPVDMGDNPELYAERLRDALPEVTTLRLPFNVNSFNADGSLHPQYERFLEAAAKEGFNFIMVQMNGPAQTTTASGPGALAEMREALTGEIYDSMEQGWNLMLDWMDAHPAVSDAVYAHEIVNEPAAYNTATFYANRRAEGLQEFVPLYAQHMVQLGQMIEERSGDAKIMVGGWNYSAQFQTMDDVMMGNGSALDYIRAGLGDSLVWSAHLYPGWLGTTGLSDPDDVRAVLDQIYAPIMEDALILTETNAQGNQAYNLKSDRPEVQGFTLAYDWFADNGVAISWFTGSQYGESNLSRIDPDGTLRFVQQASYGAAMDAFTLGGEDAAHSGDELVEIQLIQGRLRNQTNDPDYDASNEFDIAQFLGLGVGHGGDDTLGGSAMANNFLYGGSGNDRVRGNLRDDFLYGQDGNDTVNGGSSGHDHLFGGRGADSIIGGAGISQMYGGAGGDIFVAHPRGTTILVDFSPSEGDLLIVNEAGYTAADLRAQAHSVDWDQRGPRDLHVALPGGGEIIIIGMGDRLDEVANSLLPAEGNADPVEPVSDDEVLQGRPGTDILYGGAGNDTIYGDPVGGVGDDQLFGGAGNDIIYGGGAADRLEGGDNNDELYGGDGNDLLYGGMHNDLLEGGGGSDRLYGDNGSDILNGGVGTDKLYGGGGGDKLDGGGSNDLLSGDGGNDSLSGGAGFDTLYGGNGNDVLYGNEGNDTLYGDSHNDTLYGGGNTDNLYGGAGNDVLNGDIGQDNLYGDNGDDFLYGGDMADRLYGGVGNDRLFGGAGTDILSGGSGVDIAEGGGAADTFIFSLGDNSLRITDFNARQGDVLQVDSALVGGSTSLEAVQSRATVTSTGTVITFESGDTVVIDNFRGTLSDAVLDII